MRVYQRIGGVLGIPNATLVGYKCVHSYLHLDMDTRIGWNYNTIITIKSWLGTCSNVFMFTRSHTPSFSFCIRALYDGSSIK